MPGTLNTQFAPDVVLSVRGDRVSSQPKPVHYERVVDIDASTANFIYNDQIARAFAIGRAGRKNAPIVTACSCIVQLQPRTARV